MSFCFAHYKLTMISQYNRQPSNKIYALSERGYRQAQRNNSHQIWTLLSWNEESQYSVPKDQQQTFQTNPQQQTKNSVQKENNNDKDQKQVSFKLSKNNNVDADKKIQDANRSLNARKSRSIMANPKKQEEIPIQEQTQFQKLKRKSIEKYIKDQVPFTRTLSNSAFRKFYQRPCPQAYGNKNINSGGVCYGDFMKTHNIQPHTLDNKPETYQTFTSALNFGKRTKLDLEDRWKRIERQLAKNLDYRQLANMKAIGQVQINSQNKDGILKQNINHYGNKKGTLYPEQAKAELAKTSKSLDKMTTKATFKNYDNQNEGNQQKKRSKSSEKPLYFIYKYEEGDDNYNCTRYARDRHGITCYVDNCFRQNDQAFLNFQKKIKPIYAQKCRPQDINIDNIRIKNNKESKQQSFPRHYLTPNVQIPYLPNKYSRKKNVSLAQTTA